MTAAGQVQGHCDPRFEAVRDAFQESFDTGYEVGAAVAFVNNTVHGNTSFGVRGEEGALFSSFKNNIIVGSAIGVLADENAILDGGFNAFFDNDVDYDGPTPPSTNLVADPLFVDVDTDNFHLKADSPARDGGDPHAVVGLGACLDLIHQVAYRQRVVLGGAEDEGFLALVDSVHEDLYAVLLTGL